VLHADFLLGFDIEDGENMSSETLVQRAELYAVLSKGKDVFISTAGRTTNSTELYKHRQLAQLKCVY
jgi:hypothetical protein